MKNRIKVAFNEIHADSNLKRHTKATVADYIKSAEQRHKSRMRTLTLVPICSVLVVFVCFGWISYNIEVSAISIDINPSVELGINRYDRVINARGCNDDGEKLVELVDVKNMSYEKAVNAILECDEAKKLLDEEENIVVVTVDTQSEKKSEEIMDTITSCNSQCQNMYCYKSNLEDRQEAVLNNISFGKYNAYLKLKNYDPTITVDEIREMPMREIREMIRSYETATDTQEETTDTSADKNNTSCNAQGWLGNGNGNGNVNSDGSGDGNGNVNSDGSGNENENVNSDGSGNGNGNVNSDGSGNGNGNGNVNGDGSGKVNGNSIDGVSIGGSCNSNGSVHGSGENKHNGR